MARTLFFRMVFWKFSEITKNKPTFSQYNIFCNYEYFFFQSAFWSLFNHRQRSQSNQEQCSMCCSLFSCFAVHSLRVVAMLFNIISKIKRNQSFKVRISRLCYFLWLWQCLLNIFHYHNYMHQYPKYNPFPIHVSFTLTSTFIIILPLTWTRFFFIKFKFTFADTWFANFFD